MKHIWKKANGYFCQKKREKNAMKLQKVIFQKSQKLLTENLHETAYLEHSKAIHSISKAGYVTAVLVIVCVELHAREASSFFDFWKMTSYDFALFYYFFYSIKYNQAFFCCL